MKKKRKETIDWFKVIMNLIKLIGLMFDIFN